MTTTPTHIPEPTSRTAVVVGKRNGVTVVAVRMDCGIRPWVVQDLDFATFIWLTWHQLCRELTDIRVVDVAEVAAKPEPGPWLRGDELKAIMPTLKADDKVEMGYKGHTATGKLWSEGPSGLFLWAFVVRRFDGRPGVYVDALRIIERAPEPEPEPGADIPDEVVAAAGEKILATDDVFVSRKTLRAALAAAEDKWAEMQGQA